MSKNHFWILVSLAAGLGCMPAFADFEIEKGKEVPIPGPSGGPSSGVSTSISWEDLKERCLHPEQFDVQKAPQNIKIQCADTTVEFVPTLAGQVSLASTRTVVSAVLTDKFHVLAGTAVVPVASKPGTCMKFKEVEKTLTVEKPLSCNELLGIKGELAEYCASQLDHVKAANPKVIQVRDTGKVLDTCNK